MRLIDADKLKREDLCDICLSADCGDCFSDKNFAEWIASQPTAYDPDKVVEQLGMSSHRVETHEYGSEQVVRLIDAIYIVKGIYEEISRGEFDKAIEIVKLGGKV